MENSSFVDKWGTDVAAAGHTQIPNLLITHQKRLDIKPTELTVILNLLTYKWTKKNPYPSYEGIAMHAGIDRDSVKRIAKQLESKGYVTRISRGRGKTNEFNLDGLRRALQNQRSKDIEALRKRAQKLGLNEVNLGTVISLKEDTGYIDAMGADTGGEYAP